MSIQEQGASASLLHFIIVTIGRRYLAFEAGSIRELLTVQELECSEKPGIREVVDRTVDLIMQLNLTDVPIRPETPVVILTDQGSHCTIRVSHIHGQLEVQPSQILPLPTQFSSVERQWYRGMILFEQSIALILNPTWVLGEHVGSDVTHVQRTALSCMDVRDCAAGERPAC
ncbi:MAG: chemotaxis protein CheW [Nitrospira sp.]|nr:chemotaxis protein CheW [Nitrospira sp.]